MADSELNKIVSECLNEYLKLNPHFATLMGKHEYDEQMPDGTKERLLRQRDAEVSSRDKIERLDPGDLSPTARIDRECMLHHYNLALYETDVMGIWRSMPLACETIGTALFGLFSGNFAPLEERIPKIIKRLQKAPLFLKQSRSLIDDPVDIFVEIGTQSALHISEFLETIVSGAEVQGITGKVLRQLHDAAGVAIEAVNEYAAWISTELAPKARPDFAIGEEKFSGLMERRNLGISLDRIRAIGMETLSAAKEARLKAAEKIAPGKSLKEVESIIDTLRARNFAGILKKTAGYIREAREFAISSRFATFPRNEELNVEETPAYLQHLITFAAYSPPGRFSQKQTGHYFVTPIGKRKGRLKKYNDPYLLNIAVHEGYPGHHLQFVCANLNLSLARVFAEGMEFVEGWAHYCEDTVGEMGFANDPKVNFARADDDIWRAARVLVDIDLSTGRKTMNECVDFLVEETGFNRQSCAMEVRRYTFTPGYQLGYLVGKTLIKKLRRTVEEKLGQDFNLTKFHDSLLYAGSLPMRLIERAALQTLGIPNGAARP